MQSYSDHEDQTSVASAGQKRGHSSALQLGPRKKPSVTSFVILQLLPLTVCRTTQDPLVHHGRHFGRAVHAFCNVQTLITNGLAVLADQEGELADLPTAA